MSSEPSICKLCLGDSPDEVRMTRVPGGAQCKVCTLPFTLYHFKQTPRSHTVLKTVMCHNCALQRNVCQCCMRDMQWHVSIAERDQIVALVQGDDAEEGATPEARNSMMKRFLALKKGRLGGAKVTGDALALESLMQKMRGSIAQIEGEISSEKSTVASRGDSQGRLAAVDISKVLARLPLSHTLDRDVDTRSFFLYNIDRTIPEWRIGDAVAHMVDRPDWQDGESNSLVVNHRATAGAIRFSSDALALKFVTQLLESSESHSKVHDSEGNDLVRGVLRIDHYRVYVVPWKSGFSIASFGKNKDEQAKLGLSLHKLVSMQSGSLAAMPRGDAKTSEGKATKATVGKVAKSKKKGKGNGRRARSLQL